MIRLTELRTPQQQVHGEQKPAIKTKRTRLNMGWNQGTGFQNLANFNSSGINSRIGGQHRSQWQTVLPRNRSNVSRGRTTCLLFCAAEAAGNVGWLRVVGRGFPVRFGASFGAALVVNREAARN